MKKSTFNKQISTVIFNENTPLEELRSIEPAMIENCKSAIKAFHNFYFLSLVLMILWFLIRNSLVSEIKLFDISISNRTILIIAIPFVSVISYYLTITYMAFNQLIDAGLKSIQKRLYPTISKTPLIALLTYPSFIELESIKMRLSEGTLSRIGFLLVALSFLFAPIFLNGLICILLMMELYARWLILFPVAFLLVIIKTFINILFYIKQVQ